MQMTLDERFDSSEYKVIKNRYYNKIDSTFNLLKMVINFIFKRMWL